MKTTTADVGRFCVDNLKIDVSYGPREDGLGDVTIKTLMYCPDISNPDVRTDLRGEMVVTADQVALQGIAYWVRIAVQNAVEHEIDEWLRVDGARVFPPHRYEPAATNITKEVSDGVTRGAKSGAGLLRSPREDT